MRRLWLVGFGAAMMATVTGSAQVNERGAHVMRFDQDKTAHHFFLYEDGGAIDVSVNHPTDTANRDAIRSHLPHVQTMFARGDFSAPMIVHDSANVPGTSTMIELKNAIVYKYSETPQGGRVEIITTQWAALRAVHEFLTFQIRDHRTGDPVSVRKR